MPRQFRRSGSRRYAPTHRILRSRFFLTIAQVNAAASASPAPIGRDCVDSWRQRLHHRVSVSAPPRPGYPGKESPNRRPSPASCARSRKNEPSQKSRAEQPLRFSLVGVDHGGSRFNPRFESIAVGIEHGSDLSLARRRDEAGVEIRWDSRGRLPQSINQRAFSRSRNDAFSSLSSSALSIAGPASFSLMVSPCLSVMVRFVRISFRIGTTSTGIRTPGRALQIACPTRLPTSEWRASYLRTNGPRKKR
jgi:hypothetical protein